MARQCLLVFIFLTCVVGQQWYDDLLFSGIVTVIAYALLTYRINPGLKFGRLEPWNQTSPLDYHVGLDRDAQTEGRTAHPADEAFIFSSTVMITDDVPFGIQDTQPHDMPVLTNINIVQRTGSGIHNGNGDINENATLYNSGYHNIIVPNIQNAAIVQSMRDNGDAPEVVLDHSTYNINPMLAIESQDDTGSSNSRDEEDPIVSSERDVDGDDGDDSNDNNEQNGQSSPMTENRFNPTQNNEQSNQTDLACETPAASVDSPTQASEIEESVTAPVENVCQIITLLIHSTTKLALKLLNCGGSNKNSSEENTL